MSSNEEKTTLPFSLHLLTPLPAPSSVPIHGTRAHMQPKQGHDKIAEAYIPLEEQDRQKQN